MLTYPSLKLYILTYCWQKMMANSHKKTQTNRATGNSFTRGCDLLGVTDSSFFSRPNSGEQATGPVIRWSLSFGITAVTSTHQQQRISTFTSMHMASLSQPPPPAVKRDLLIPDSSEFCSLNVCLSLSHHFLSPEGIQGCQPLWVGRLRTIKQALSQQSDQTRKERS